MLADVSEGRDNNFNLIRFVAAGLVLFTHCFALSSGSGETEPLRASVGMSWGDIAVDVFFVTSGFLIAKSWAGRRDATGFAWARFIRIWPALIVSVLFCACVVGPVFTTRTLPDYFSHPTTLRFIAKNILLLGGLEPNLPGVFSGNPSPDAINGSLWTLPHEVRMYAILALVLLALELAGKRFPRLPAPKISLLVVTLALVTRNLRVFFTSGGHPPPETNLVAMFFCGAAFYYWRDRVRLSPALFAGLCVALAAAATGLRWFFPVYALALPYGILFLAYAPSGPAKNFNRIGDYSYGVYIYAFPVQQAIIHSFPGCSAAFVFACSLPVTLGLGGLSWHLIEKKCLKLKKRALPGKTIATNPARTRRLRKRPV